MTTQLATTVQDSANDTGAAVVILCDVSGSMRGKRIERLRQALQNLWPEIRKARLLAFSDEVKAVAEPQSLPEPGGGTVMHLALYAAAKLMPAKAILISDGLPEDQERALVAASCVPGVVDVIFVGDADDKQATDFMMKLARIGGGQSVVRDIGKSAALLAPTLREMLALPSPIAL